MNPFSLLSLPFRWLDGRTVAGARQPIKVNDAEHAEADGLAEGTEVAVEAATAAFDIF